MHFGQTETFDEALSTETEGRYGRIRCPLITSKLRYVSLFLRWLISNRNPCFETVLFLFERGRLWNGNSPCLYFVLKIEVGFGHESCCLRPVFHSKLDFCLVKSYHKLLCQSRLFGAECTANKPTNDKNIEQTFDVRQTPYIPYILLILSATADNNSGSFDRARGFFSKFDSSVAFSPRISCKKPFSFRNLLVHVSALYFFCY